MKIQQPKKPEIRTKVDFLFERANILSKKPARKIGQKIKKKPTFEDKPWPKLVKNSHFLGQRWDHRSPYHLSTLGIADKECHGNYLLISKEQHWRSPAKKLEEQSAGLPGKNPQVKKRKLIGINQVYGWKEWYLGSKKIFFLFEFGLIVLVVLKCLFRHNFCRSSLPPAEKLSLFTQFCSNNRFSWCI